MKQPKEPSAGWSGREGGLGGAERKENSQWLFLEIEPAGALAKIQLILQKKIIRLAFFGSFFGNEKKNKTK